ncbi:thymidylate kinase [uncultured Selenomonas sp.]|uniref:dTMP kinase n=1 Tax=uncultured Selenomonas sp. TaxID=159275 RepID=UPI00262462E8|nr:thymidylate kinase [uncultured Selenomonas sp.]
MQTKGKLLVLEAGDGSGKATQTKMLEERLAAEGRRVRQVEFPDYESPSSALVRMYLGGDFGERASEVNAYAASAFFAVDRYASFQTKWRADLESGAIVLADRYTTANMVHQAVKIENAAEREAFLAWLEDFEYGKLALPRPDLVLFLDMDPAVSRRLIAARAATGGAVRDIHERDEDYLVRCHRASVHLAMRCGWQRIRCSEAGEPLSREAVHEEIYEAVRRIL